MNITSFKSIKLRLASAEEILSWSHGEILKPETINYRTGRPEKDGLFCERIFGPTKDWQCYCGKYKRIRYKGIICEKCGVEVTRSVVRRERMGHIDLAVPVSHIWFLKSLPSRIGVCLNMRSQDLEKVIYFAAYIVVSIKKKAKTQALKKLQKEFKNKIKKCKKEDQANIEVLNLEKNKALAKNPQNKQSIEKEYENLLINLDQENKKKNKKVKESFDHLQKELKNLKVKQILSEIEFRDLSLKYSDIFEAGIGAESIRMLLEKIDIKKKIDLLNKQLVNASKAEQEKIKKQLIVLEAFYKSKQKPAWMVFKTLPVIPPDLRPMVQLDGGRFAASDLNDLYRRVINRNNRLKRLQELNAPEVIQRNEKRMLQEAVDSLIDNEARKGRAVASTTGQKRTLKSLADMLKGKQGRFRQNLLGKRVDYSGRSVIVVGANLKLHQCGIPKIMALELFKPFIINRLIEMGLAHNVRSAGKLIETGASEVWDALEEVIKNRYILLNRAPTLHRLSVQAFRPILIEGKAIQLHPMVCAAFNADFDGDQMAVHLPLSELAQKEARDIILSTKNILKPATGRPIATATKDVVLGIYYITNIKPGSKGEGKIFSSEEEAVLAWQFKRINLQSEIKIRIKNILVTTSVGRVLLNQILPKRLKFFNKHLNKKDLDKITSDVLKQEGLERAIKLIDDLKDLGFHFLTISGLSWGMDDLQIPKDKKRIVAETEQQVEAVMNQYNQGLLTDEERYNKVVFLWAKAKENITKTAQSSTEKFGSLFSMIDSGARGSWGQATQMIGMKGLVANPSGKTIELPIKDSFKEGFSVLEYFISTHGARKGMTDTALRTASAGYLTRRLVDVAQDIVVHEKDCGVEEGISFYKNESEEIGKTLADRSYGRILAEDVLDLKTGKIILSKGILVQEEQAEILLKSDLNKITVYSPLVCKTNRGVCQKCYAMDLGRREIVKIGEAVGIIAAQSIGEPGTQLTMRTFHTGGVAEGDITQGLPRVEELFEVRTIKNAALLADVSAIVDIIEREDKKKILRLISEKEDEDKYEIMQGARILVKDNDLVHRGEVIMKTEEQSVKAKKESIVCISQNEIILKHRGNIKDYTLPEDANILVKKGSRVKKGDILTDGSLDLRKLFQISGGMKTQKYIIHEIQKIYTNQGQDVKDKHIEVIIRQMFSRVRINESGDSRFIANQIADKFKVEEENNTLIQSNKNPSKYEELILGVTKASLNTDSFLSAASFQETMRILVDAAILNKEDRLEGLKENVIIGKLIPAGTGYRQRQSL